MKHVFIVGSKGIPAQYGGFETFVENLTKGKQSEDIAYHVSCMDNSKKTFIHNDAECFNVCVPFPGAPGRIFHMGLVLQSVMKWAKEHLKEEVVVYILGCRVGPLLIPFRYALHSQGIKIYCNPDGLEWKRSKWNALAKRFLHFCEKCLVENSDFVVCDSMTIEKYIKTTYKNKVNSTTFIAYGANIEKSICDEKKLEQWYAKYDIKKNNYYLIVGRFVPENNYDTMITEFMKSRTKKNLVIITNVEKNKFYNELLNRTHFDKDERIKFVGTVYDSELLKKIREEAYAYIHGHEVGGTNPSLLEALASTKLNLLLQVGFNKEVGGKTALYWDKTPGSLSELINRTEQTDDQKILELDKKSTERIKNNYNWDKICKSYESIFLQ